MEDVLKQIIETVVLFLDFFYRTLEILMPFIILSIYNKVVEIERKINNIK